MTTSIKATSFAVFFIITLVCTAGCADDQPAYNPRSLMKPLPAIVQPELQSAQQANEILQEDELVISVVTGQEARAYPINMLTGPHREIVNEVVGETAYAATW